MFISFDEGATWQPFQLNLPRTPITDLVVKDRDLVLSTMGRSFWILTDLSPLYDVEAGTAEEPARLVAPGPAYRTSYRVPRNGEAGPNYPPPGAVIDYWIGEPVRGELVLEILDDDGRVVRTFSSAGADTASAGMSAVERMALGDLATRMTGAGTAPLDADQGMHRFVWDLSHPGAWHPDPRRRGRGGPTAVPGDYTVRLRAGEWSATRPLRLLMDPRAAEDGVTQADLEAQLALNLQIRDLLSRAGMAVARVERAIAAGDASRELRSIHAALVTSREGSYQQPMLVDQISYLYGMTSGADQRPGDQVYRRYEELDRELAVMEERIRRELR